jgi:prophage DNA circulation protein
MADTTGAPTLRPNPFAGYELDRAYRFDPESEATYKGIELRATTMTIRRGHDEATHAYPDVPGGNVEVTGRQCYEVELETVWTGTSWRERLANAVYIHDTRAGEVGELALPDGPAIDAKWLRFDETRQLAKDGTTLRAVFKEHSHVDSVYTAQPDAVALMARSVPDPYSETILPLVETYTAALDAGTTEALATMIQALVLLDNAAYAAQQLCDVAAADGLDNFELLMTLRANARRAFPPALRVDLSAVLTV